MQIRIAYWLFLLTFSSIFWVSKSFTIENFGFRPEDVPSLFAVILSPILIMNYGRRVPKLLSFSLCSYLLYVLVVSFLNTPNYIFNLIVLFIKETSYLAYFIITLIFSSEVKNKQLKKFIEVVLLTSIPIFIYAVYQLYNGSTGMYGLSVFGHEKSPASSGLIALSVFYLSFLYTQLFKVNWFSLTFVLSAAILVLVIGSKLAAIGLLTFAISYVILDLHPKNFFKGIFGVLILYLILLFSINSGIGNLYRLNQIFNPIDAVLNRGIWFKFDWFENWVDLLFGQGLSIGHIDKLNNTFSYGMAMDNQLLYFTLVVGLAGTLIYLFILFLLVDSHGSKSIEKKLQISLIISFLAMGMGAEVFQLSISGIIFWIISGLLIGISVKKLRSQATE